MRLIAITGYGSQSDRARVREAGFDGHLVKPVDIDELLRAIDVAPAELSDASAAPLVAH